MGGGSRLHARYPDGVRGDDHRTQRTHSELPNVQAWACTARACACRAVAARAPPWAPSLASQCLNVRCKKTYRAPQRTNLLASVTL